MRAPKATSRLQNRNVRVHGHRTSIRMEKVLWDAIDEIAAWEGITKHQVIEGAHDAFAGVQLTSAVRVVLLNYYRERWLKARDIIVADEAAEKDLVGFVTGEGGVLLG